MKVVEGRKAGKKRSQCWGARGGFYEAEYANSWTKKISGHPFKGKKKRKSSKGEDGGRSESRRVGSNL